MPLRRSNAESSLLHTVEEATQLLRRVPVAAWLWWFGTSMPFLAALIHFWNSMSRASNAWSMLADSALTLSLWYAVMKVGHACFADHMLRVLRLEAVPATMPWRGRLRLVASQLLIHSTMPWIILLASLLVLPVGWAYAFYHNVSLLAVSTFRAGGRTRELVAKAWEQSKYRPRQNHAVILVISVVGFIVWLNVLVGTYLVGTIGSSVLGSANEITRNPWVMLSTSMLAGTVALSWLVVGPLAKAFYAVRCFHGQSRRNGEDLLVAFQAARGLMVALLMFGSLSWAAPAACAELNDSKPLDSKVLDEKIRQVFQEDDFQWRMPRDLTREQVDAAEKGIVAEFMNSLVDLMKEITSSIVEGVESLLKKIFKGWFNRSRGEPADSSGGAGRGEMIEGLLWVFLIVMVLAVLWLVYKHWRQHTPAVAKAVAAAPELNLESDQVIASQLPESEWLKLAQEKMQQGDCRLAMRALFLATLAHLGERRYISITKTKSNGDYLRELGLRARQRPALQEHFRQSVRAFDWAWYGWHEVTADLLEQFRGHHQQILADQNGMVVAS